MRRYLENCRSIRLAVFLVISEFLNEHFSGSILNGVDDDFSTPFFVFTKYLRNAIK